MQQLSEQLATNDGAAHRPFLVIAKKTQGGGVQTLPSCARPRVKLRDFHLCSMCSKSFLHCGRTEEACIIVKSFGNVDFFASYWPLYMKNLLALPLEKILGAPLL